MTDNNKRPDIVSANRSAVLKKQRIHREAKATATKVLATGALGLVLLIGYLAASGDKALDAQSADAKACEGTDAQCLGRKALIHASDTCLSRIESQLSFVPEWDNGLLQPRLTTQGWYQPGQTLIHDGNSLIAQNGFGAKKRVRYFCVTTVSGAYVKSGIVE